MSKLSSNNKTYIRNTDIEALQKIGYKIGKKIGIGTYATVVFSQYTDKLDKTISLAAKIIDKNKANTEILDKFLKRELEILKKLEHPNIIQVHSILQRGSNIFIFMRHAENGDLLDFIKSRGPLIEDQAKLWFNQLIKGIQYLHTFDIAHRDLKCENILITKKMNIKIADFGFARYCCDENGSNILSETFCGSAAYASPEVISGTPYNAKMADIWSMGVILFTMVNASLPFDDNNIIKLLNDQKSKKICFRTNIDDTISNDCKLVISSLLDPDVSSRLNLENLMKCNWLQKQTIKSINQ